MSSVPQHMAAVERTIAAIVVVVVAAVGAYAMMAGRGSSSPSGGEPSVSSSLGASPAAAISTVAAAPAPSAEGTVSPAAQPTSPTTKTPAKSGGGSAQSPLPSQSPASSPLASNQESTPKPRRTPKPTKTPGSAPAPSATRASVNRAISYFCASQLTSGGFDASGQAASTTPWVVQAIAAAGGSASTFKRSGGKSPIAYLQSLDIDNEALSGTGSTRNPATVYAKLIISYRAAGVSSLIGAAGSGRIDLVSRLLAYENRQSGAFTTNLGGSDTYAAVSTTTWAVIALRAAGTSASQLATSVSWLAGQQASNGGFSYTPGGSSDTDSTAAAIEALRAGGVAASSSTIQHALSYLRSQQMSNGGFASGMGTTTNAESTAWAVQAIRAAGQNPGGASWKNGGKTPIAFLLSLQASSGAFYHFGKTLAMPLVTTSQVVVALSGKTYPF